MNAERQAVYSARWKARHPERYAEANRRKSRVRAAADRLLRAMFPDEYTALCAHHGESVPADWARYRAATRDLRVAHPEAWAECRRLAREENK